MCTIKGDIFFCSQRIPGSETQAHHVISPTMILAYMISPTLTSLSKVALVLCLLQRKASSKSRYIKSGPYPMACEFCPKVGANLFSLTYELSQGNKI